VEAVVQSSALIAAAQQGDAEAREAFARDCLAIAWRVAVRLTGDPDAARDHAQETVMRCLRALDRFQSDRPLTPWVAQIVRNIIRDAARRRRVRKVAPLHAERDDIVLEPADPTPDPEELARRHQLQRMVWRCLAELDEGQREIIVMRDFGGLSYAEIADVLGVPRGTVMSRLHRARRRLAHEVRRRSAGGAP
jgi:RNA polymerase sigma-70 factor (ECF subfamily)